ncbi:MAG: glycosyltransferase [Myxococcales bacterium]|nr:glycosyltransferase [Myxococcales bacterium]
MTRPLKILFLIPKLDYGGAERQLVYLATGLHRRGHRICVATFYSGGALEPELRAAGVRVRSAEKRGRRDVTGFLLRLARLVRDEQPEILHGYTAEPNALAALLKPIVPGVRVVMGIRNSRLEFQEFHWLLRLAHGLERSLSPRADCIIVNSNSGLKDARVRGYPTDRMLVVANGIDAARFRPDPDARRRRRAQWEIGDHEVLVGHAARLDPMKDHSTFLRAAAASAKRRPELRFVCVGTGTEPSGQQLVELSLHLGLEQRLRWVGAVQDMPSAYCACDALVSSSAFGEGFPNVVAEAMACAVPCVVTDVGDSAFVVGGTGLVVRPADAQALAFGLEQVLSRKQDLGPAARARIIEHFSVDQLVEKSEAALLRLARANIGPAHSPRAPASDRGAQ